MYKADGGIGGPEVIRVHSKAKAKTKQSIIRYDVLYSREREVEWS